MSVGQEAGSLGPCPYSAQPALQLHDGCRCCCSVCKAGGCDAWDACGQWVWLEYIICLFSAWSLPDIYPSFSSSLSLSESCILSVFLFLRQRQRQTGAYFHGFAMPDVFLSFSVSFPVFFLSEIETETDRHRNTEGKGNCRCPAGPRV